MDGLVPLLRQEDLAAMQEVVAKTHVSETVVEYVVALIDATRHHSHILRGASPRATLSVTSMAKAVAQLRGRDYVVPKDVQEVFLRTIPHRLLLSNMAQSKGLDCGQILRDILNKVEVPHIR
jgi:MoxR-like ATPase